MSAVLPPWTNIPETIDQAHRQGADLHHVLLLVHAEGRQHCYEQLYGHTGQLHARYEHTVKIWGSYKQRTSQSLPQPDESVLNQVHWRITHLIALIGLDVAVLEELSSERFDEYRRWMFFKRCEGTVRSGLRDLEEVIDFWADTWQHNQAAAEHVPELRVGLAGLHRKLLEIDEPDKHQDEHDADNEVEKN